MESQEKRRYPRVTTHIPIKYRKLTETEDADRSSTISKNLSEGGIRFMSPDFISRACRLILELDMPMFIKPVKAISKVAWIRKASSGNEYEIGSQFLEMSKKDKGLVSEYVNSLTFYNEPGKNKADTPPK